jgi:HEAT repeat protein
MINEEKFLEIVILITIIETYLILSLIIALFGSKIVVTFFDKIREKRRNGFSKFLVQLMESEVILNEKLISKKFQNPKIMLPIIEDFDEKFADPKWKKIEKFIIKTYLLDYALKWVNSSSWEKRFFSARCFVLYPAVEYENEISLLLYDSVPLVRITAAISAVAVGSVTLLQDIFHVMLSEPVAGRYPYRDAIFKGSTSIFTWIKQQIKIEKDPEKRFMYLDILGTRFDSNILKYIRDDLDSKNFQLRKKSVEILVKFPNKETEQLILPFLQDPSPKIRSCVIKALPMILGKDSIKILENFLKDINWWVRFQAALGLNSFGDIGKHILLNQEKEGNELAYEVAKYALSLPPERQ